MRRLLALASIATALAGCGHLVILNDPLTAAEHNDLGVAYEARGQDALAAREYQRALRDDHHFARARVNLANLAAKAGRWTEAERGYRRALQDLPSDVDARNNLAIAVTRQGRAGDEAEWLARSAVALARGDSLPRATLAEVVAARRAPHARRLPAVRPTRP